MSAKVNDSYTVLLREKKLPMQLLEDPEKKLKGKQVGAGECGVACGEFAIRVSAAETLAVLCPPIIRPCERSVCVIRSHVCMCMSSDIDSLKLTPPH